MKSEVVEKLASLITAAFGLVAALAWNEAIQKTFRQLFGEASSLGAMIMYAMLVTIIAVVATLQIGRLAEKTKTKSGRKGQSRPWVWIAVAVIIAVAIVAAVFIYANAQPYPLWERK